MSPLDWFKKEKPLLGLLGMGGGGSGEAAAFEITGGTKHTTPTHYIHTFASSGSFKISNQALHPTSLTFDVVMVGGGGGAAQDKYTDNRGAGGGGAGMFRTDITGISIADGDHPVTVGAGGAGSGAGDPNVLTNSFAPFGSPTTFVISPTTTYTAGGGGGGANHGGPGDPMGGTNASAPDGPPLGGSGGGGSNSAAGGSAQPGPIIGVPNPLKGCFPGGEGGTFPWGSGGA